MKIFEIFLLILTVLGGLDLAGRGWQFLLNIFPRLLSLQSRLWRFTADSVALPGLRRRAIVTRVEEVLNQTAFRLQQHLPKGWVKRARIRWLRNPKSTEFSNGELLLRIRPESGPDTNLMQALSVYFDSALFPDTRDLIPKDTIKGVALAIARSSLEETHPYLVKEFDERFLAHSSGQDSALYESVSDCIRLNE